eukprot:Gb_32843 [translate_table: standard]
MSFLGNPPLHASFLYCNFNNRLCLPKPHFLGINPIHIHKPEPITAKFEDQWTYLRGETRKPFQIPSSPESQRVEDLQKLRSGTPHERLDLQAMDEEVLRMKRRKVAVFWDLDNKPPKVRPFDAAMAVRQMAGKFGDLVDIAAYANRHAFTHVPQWVVEERRERKKLDALESQGLVKPEQLYLCGVCGRKCKTNVALKKHFKELHERERQKKLNRMNSLKGKRKAKFREQYRAKDEKYKNAAQNLLFPKVGYGLASQLRRAGVYVKTVEDKPQAADAALKRQIQHSMTRGINCICLISDDSDFSVMLNKARQNNMRTIVLGDSKALKNYADLWLSWDTVASGNAWDEINIIAHKWSVEEAVLDEILDSEDIAIDEDYRDDFESNDSEMDQVAEEFVKAEGNLGSVHRVSAFSEEEQQLQEEDEHEKLEGQYHDEDEDWDSDEDEDNEEESAFWKWRTVGMQRN